MGTMGALGSTSMGVGSGAGQNGGIDGSDRQLSEANQVIARLQEEIREKDRQIQQLMTENTTLKTRIRKLAMSE